MAIRLFEALKEKCPDKHESQKKIVCEQTWKTIVAATYNDQLRQATPIFDMEVAKGLDTNFDQHGIIEAAESLRRIPHRI